MAKVRMSRWLAAGLGALLLASLPGSAAAAPAAPAGSRAPVPQRERAVPGGRVPVLPVKPDAAAAAALRGAPAVRWPAAAAAQVALPATGGAPATPAVRVAAAAGSPASVRVEVL